MKQVAGIGAGGHAKTVIEAIRSQGRYEIIGLLDENEDRVGTTWMDIPIIGTDDNLATLREKGIKRVFIGVGGVGDLRPRMALFAKVKLQGFEIIRAIHSGAWVSPSAELEEGATVLAQAAINASTQIGCNVIVNTGAIVEHDCVVGDHVHISPGAVLAGHVTVGEAAFIGAGACVRQGVRIGRRAIVGMGAAVIRDVEDDACVVGVPAVPIPGPDVT